MYKVAHLVHRLEVGGLESFMINMINKFPTSVQHVIIVLTKAGSIVHQLRSDVQVVELNKSPGTDLATYIKFYSTIKKHKIDLLHTYNIGTIEYHFVARIAGISAGVHAEHGREAGDPKGLNKRYNLLRRTMSPLIGRYIAVSEDLEYWLVKVVKIPHSKVQKVSNGVDLTHFTYSSNINDRSKMEFLHIARLQKVKNQLLLINAFLECLSKCEVNGIDLPRLTIVGDGPDMDMLIKICLQSKYTNYVSFVGQQLDTKKYYHASDLFILTSIAEGTPITILESMACGVPVLATRVGGIPQIIDENTGFLVESGDMQGLIEKMWNVISKPEILGHRKAICRNYVERNFDLDQSVKEYKRIYDTVFLK